MVSIGPSKCVFLTGYQPKNTPVAVQTAKESMTENISIETGLRVKTFIILVAICLLSGTLTYAH